LGYNDNVAIVLWSKKPMAIVIKNKQIAGSFDHYFTMLWEQGGKI